MTKEEALKIWLPVIKMGVKSMQECSEALDMAIAALEQETWDVMGEVSDGYHTFNQLYHQRAVLFATIVNQNKDKSWKSFKHSDGNYCFDSNGEWFVVGIDTPQGSYTYHYAKEYWDMFDCEELECGKEWDGHTEEDVTRLLSLQNEPCEDAISREAAKNACLNGWNKDYKEIVAEIRALPPVKPAEKTGSWEWIQYHCDTILGDWVCSECRSVAVEGVMKYNVKPTYKYCPQCGCKIQEVSRNE